MNTKDKNKGFTLVELLVVFGILALVGGIMSDLFVGILKGVNKSNIINEIKQNGNYVVNYFDRAVRNSASIVFESSDTLVIEYKNLDQVDDSCVRFKIYNAIDEVQNGYISLSTAPTCFYDEEYQFDDLTFPEASEKKITNVDVTRGVSVIDGEFVVTRPTGKPPTVLFSFTLSQGEKSSSRRDFKASELFQTFVTLRTN